MINSLIPSHPTGKTLDRSVVQRIQRFSQGSIFKRSVLQAIAAELLDAPGGAGSPGFEGDLDDAGDEARVDMTSSGGFRPVIAVPNAEVLKALFDGLDLGEGQGDTVGMEQLATRLKAMGEYSTNEKVQ